MSATGRDAPGSWRRLLTECGAALPLAAPTELSVLAGVERDLAVALPTELRSLLAECGGVRDRYGMPVIWPAAEIARSNREFRMNPEFRDLYMPFDALLFFGQAGNGDQFFYRILAGAVRERDVYLWDHETDSRIWRATDLQRFLTAVLEADAAPEGS